MTMSTTRTTSLTIYSLGTCLSLFASTRFGHLRATRGRSLESSVLLGEEGKLETGIPCVVCKRGCMSSRVFVAGTWARRASSLHRLPHFRATKR
ncbi:hypothetical protein K443DRAFT_285108 [Laccaria amethystina LaAM-08-1]|uniref:Unplaced genomic scaffold K443scaffold_188, whole genome shotgun sequence n=1 Tax=Laccaria amethystina LaAM-08-1 TaxID=1095629 RepID=A0A0C9WKJ0_9AGAR|nr:hypothetical protein K443DRAFT_285108 [Laccaria amethystina LaAM-08-1]